MKTNTKWIIVAVVAVILVVAIGALVGHQTVPSGAINNGAEVHNNAYWFTNNTGGTSGMLYVGRSQQFSITDAGTVSNSGNTSLTGTLTVGASGTAQSNQVNTTCSMKADNSITASSTGYAYCTGVTGVTSADFVNAVFSTSTLGFAMTNDGWEILSAKASTTAGAIDFILYNDTGRTVAPSAAGRMASTTDIWAGH